MDEHRFAVLVEHRATGRLHRSRPLDVPYDADTVWWLTEGSMGCDCNRALLFGVVDPYPYPCDDGLTTDFRLLAIVEADLACLGGAWSPTCLADVYAYTPVHDPS